MTVVAVLGLVKPELAMAQLRYSQPNQIVVRGVVPERRTIVVDGSGKILQITSNTPNDVPPSVHLMAQGGAEIPLSPTIHAQYKAVMAHLGDNKIVEITPVGEPISELFPRFIPAVPGRVYDVAPVKWGGFGEQVPYRIAL